MLSHCHIHLDNYNSGIYYAGSEILGRVVCYFSEKTTLRAIKVRIECKEHNEWQSVTKDIYGELENIHKFLRGDNTVLDVVQTLFGSDEESHVFNAGRYEYPFSYVLPNDIPSSFTGRFGWISYKLKAIVDPTAVYYENEFGFVVHSPIDFNRMPPELQNPACYLEEEIVSNCCLGGEITLDVEIPKKAFIPGEIIPVKVHVCNLSNRNVKNVQVLFRKLQKHKVSDLPHRQVKVEVFKAIEHMEHGVGAHGEHTFNIDFKLPEDMFAPNFSRCKLFEVTYVFKVICIMPTWVQNVTMETLDIVVGHIPWGSRDLRPSAPMETPTRELGLPSYNDVTSSNHDLPSYEE